MKGVKAEGKKVRRLKMLGSQEAGKLGSLKAF